MWRKLVLLVQCCCLQAWLSLISDSTEKFLDLSNCTSWIQPFRACTCAIHDCMTTIHTEWISQVVETSLGRLITWIDDPAICLHEHSWAEILVAIPPVRWTRCRAASTQNAFVESIEFSTIVDWLQVLRLSLLLCGDVAAIVRKCEKFWLICK